MTPTTTHPSNAASQQKEGATMSKINRGFSHGSTANYGFSHG